MVQEILEKEMKGWLHTSRLGQKFIYDEVVASTNIRIKELAAAGAPEGTVAAAGMQTAGRGRRGRGWVSPVGGNVYLSVLLRPDFRADRAPMLTMVTAYAVAQAVREAAGLPVEVKWPNDLVIHGKKVCGILTEMAVTGKKIQYVVTGIGINTNMTEFPEEIARTATSLVLESGREVNQARLIGSMLNHLEKAYDRYVTEQNLRWMQQEYNSILVNYEKEVRVLDPAGEYGGVSYGIDEEGRLLVKREDGSLTGIYSGEVSVRGIYGYAE